MEQWRSWWADSRGKVSGILAILWIANFLYQPRLVLVTQIVLATLVTVVFDSLLVKLRQKIWVFSLSSVVTGLLVGLILEPTGSLVVLVTACLTAVLSKQFLAIGPHKHIFNPAAFGLVFSSLVFDRPVAWWGGSGGLLPILILFIGMLPILGKLRRLRLPGLFLVIYFFSHLGVTDLAGAFRLSLDGTVTLFALVMLPEPVTAVTQGTWRYGWGLLVGSLVVLQNLLRVSVADPLLLALLIANGTGFILRRRMT